MHNLTYLTTTSEIVKERVKEIVNKAVNVDNVRLLMGHPVPTS